MKIFGIWILLTFGLYYIIALMTKNKYTNGQFYEASYILENVEQIIFKD